MKKVALKICGMKANTQKVAALQPEYLGFIFYKKSPRYFDGNIPSIPSQIKKVGVFVNASISGIVKTVKKHQLDVIQLHGDESASFCQSLSNLKDIECDIWKVFGIKDSFDFSVLTAYEPHVSAFLFDTKGANKGGNGYTFDWSILKGYTSTKPFVLSGGIGMTEINQLSEILSTTLPIIAIDVNSKFEEQPGLKNTIRLQQFINELNIIQSKL